MTNTPQQLTPTQNEINKFTFKGKKFNNKIYCNNIF